MGKIKTTAIIVAAGKGTRMGANINKQYIQLLGKPLLAHTLSVFERSPLVEEIILVVGKDEIPYCQIHIVEGYRFKKVSRIVEGGKERRESVYKGLLAAESFPELVVVHDGARPFLTEAMLQEVLREAKEVGAAILAVPVKDTIKVVDEKQLVVSTPFRESLWAVQTPQAFRYSLLKDAHCQGQLPGITDDAMLVEALGHPVKVVMGSYSNLKITTPEDLLLAEEIIKKGESL
ncbi:2-C-methyl-D-erythritol 4-phosphate cytidylyltransferase [Alkaliphilus crotonatoxidans]